MLTLVTVIYGSNPTFRTELFASVLSILKLRQSTDTRVLIYTDRLLEDFPLPVDQYVITPVEWHEWTRGSNLTHLVKLHLVQRTLEDRGHPVIYFDTDTLFLTAPESLAARLSPATALMHANEGPIANYPIWARICEWFGRGRTVQGILLSPSSEMHNSGIVGVVPEHLPALRKSVLIADALQEVDPIFSLDQFATGNALSEGARVLTCENEVLHYWGWRRGFIRHAIEQFRQRNASASLEDLSRTFDLAAIAGLPPIHWQDRLQAKLTKWLRGYDPDTGFACLALRSAIRHQHTDPTIANLWFNVHLQFLRTCQASDKNHAHLRHELASQHSACMRWLDAGNSVALRELRRILPE